MQESLLKIVPVILVFLIGYITKVIKLFSDKEADTILKFVFYTTVPPLVINSFSRVEITFDYMFLPAGAAVLIALMFIISGITGRKMKLPPESLGVLIVGTMIMNTGFQIPFVYAVYGDEGLARLTMLDLGNVTIAFTFVYFQAIKYGTNKEGGSIYKKFLNSAPLWGLSIGILLNILSIKLPTTLSLTFDLMGSATVPLTMFSLGVYFKPKFGPVKYVIPAIFIRMGIGLAIGLVLAELFNLEGLNRTILIVCAGAPIGYTTLIFSGSEGLDKNYASGIVSFSLILGIITTPFLLLFFHP